MVVRHHYFSKIVAGFVAVCMAVLSACVTKIEIPPATSSSPCMSRSEIDPPFADPFDPDPEKLNPEQLLSAYLQVNTSQPEGCEGKAARFWKRFFDRYGIENEIVPLPFGEDRANIIARVRQKKGKKRLERPVILLSHLDVGPAAGSGWSVSPFSGTIDNGYVYGRGASGAKATAVIHAIAMVQASRRDGDISRDMIFLGTANSEGVLDADKGVITGAQWMIKNRRKMLERAEYVVTTGGAIPMSDGVQRRWEISTAEKSRLEITLVPSSPQRDIGMSNKLIALAAAKIMTEFSRPLMVEEAKEQTDDEVASDASDASDALSHEITDKPVLTSRPVVLADPLVRANYETTHALTVLGGLGQRHVMPAQAYASLLFVGGAARRTAVEAAVIRSMFPGVGVSEIRQFDGNLRMMLRSAGVAVSAVTPPLNGGANAMLVKSVARIVERVKTREIPAKDVMVESLSSMSAQSSTQRPEAVIDVRLLPGESFPRVVSDLQSLVAGMGVTLAVTGPPIATSESPTETPLFASITAVHRRFTDSLRSRPPLETPVLTHTTDAAYFRQVGLIVYGFDPLPLDVKDIRPDGVDERITVTSIRYACAVTSAYLFDFLRESRNTKTAQSLQQ
jgi:acetylornithine deacetylase/succinyl-diaminopimelate desuccinylase-like protein